MEASEIQARSDTGACRNHLGLPSEDVMPGTRELWGNFPQTCSMVGVVNGALRLSRPRDDVVRELREDAAFGARILEPFELAGVERWDESAVILRGRFRVAPLEQWNVRREYLRRLKAAFDLHGIEIPFPQLAIHPRAEWTAPALRGSAE